MTDTHSSFQTEKEKEDGADFLENGYVTRDIEDKDALDKIRRLIVENSRTFLRDIEQAPHQDYLDTIASQVAPNLLNEFRLHLLRELGNTHWLRAAYYSLAREMLATLVGNELAMQKNINLSIQMPGDESSLLPVHADVLNGDSPFEVVLWVPLVDCYATKSMFILSPERSRGLLANLKAFSSKTSEDLFEAIKDDVTWLSVPYGKFVIFSQNLLHGNRVNEEMRTRWSMNCRFKSLMSPYADKRFGEFFEPINIRPATSLGLSFELPTSFDEQ